MRPERLRRASTPLLLFLVLVCTRALAAQREDQIYEASFFADARPETAMDMIRRVPGFTFDSGLSPNGTQARGYASSAGNVLIDGVRPTAKSDALDALLERIPAADVDRIEVLHAGAPGIDMQGRTVIANVVRRSNRATTATASAVLRTFSTGLLVPEASVTATRRSGQRNYEGALTIDGTFDDLYGASGRHEVFDGASATTLSERALKDEPLDLRATVKGATNLPLLGGRLGANVMARNLPYRDRLTYESPARTRVFDTWENARVAELGVDWRGTAGVTELEAVLLQSLRRETGRNVATEAASEQRFDSRSTSGESILRASARYRIPDGPVLEAGGEAVFNFLRGRTGFMVNGLATPLPSPDVEVEERRGEVFVSADWKLAERWLLGAGARAEASRIDFHGDNELSQSLFYPQPRLLLSFVRSPAEQVRLRFAKVVGQLVFDNFIATSNLQSTGITAGNGQLMPDRRTQYELSWERHFAGDGVVTLSMLHEDIRDPVDYVPVFTPTGVLDAPGNLGRARNEQLGLSFALPLDGFGFPGGLFRGNGTWNFSHVTDPVTGEDRVLSNQRPRVLSFTLSQDLPKLKSSWSLDYITCGIQDRHYYRLTEIRSMRCRTAPYLIARWSVQPAPSWNVGIEAQDFARAVFEERRDRFAGSRDGNALVATDRLRLRLVPIINLQVRKTLGE